MPNREITHTVKTDSFSNIIFAFSWEKLMSRLQNQQCLVKTQCKR